MSVADVASLVDRTELSDIRLQKLTGEVLRTPPEEMTININTEEPRFALAADSILALFTHRVEYSGPDPDDEGASTPVGRVETTHIVELALRGEGVPSNEAISALLAGNVLFMVYPYVRAALHRLPAEFGLPPVFLPYLRRTTVGLVSTTTPTDDRDGDDLAGGKPQDS